LIKLIGYNSFKQRSQPVHQLVESGTIFASTGALSNQGRVRGKDDTLLNTTISLATDLAIMELHKQEDDLWVIKRSIITYTHPIVHTHNKNTTITA